MLKDECQPFGIWNMRSSFTTLDNFIGKLIKYHLRKIKLFIPNDRENNVLLIRINLIKVSNFMSETFA